MAWGTKSTNGPVTVAYLLERRVDLKWQEAVAIVLEIAELLERSGKRSVPRHENLALTPSGSVDFRRGRTQSGDAVSALAGTLSALLPRDRPTQLRLLVSTAGPETGAYKTVTDFVEALQYFERPGRRNTISEVHQRALEAPVSTGTRDDEEPPKFGGKPSKKKPLRSRLLVPAMAVLLLAVVVGGATLWERTQPGALGESTAPIENMATDAWATALEATAGFRESAARDLSVVLDRMRGAAGDLTGEESVDEAEAASEVAPASTESRRVEPRSEAIAEAASAAVSGPVTVGDGEGVNAESLQAAADVEGTEIPVEVIDPLAADALFDSSDVNVTPPVTLRLQLPSLGEDQPWDESVGVVEAIVAANGEVEKVKLVSPPDSIHQAMILSAIKTWRFRPAEKDGQPVRYRQLIPVAIPR